MRHREDNEQLDRVYGALPGPAAYHCECGASACERRVVLDRRTYRAVRSDPRQFVVAAGHEYPVGEVVVSDHAGYVVVRQLDPVDVRD